MSRPEAGPPGKDPSGEDSVEQERAGWGGIRWGSPQVLLSLLTLIFAASFALRSQPPQIPPAPTLALESDDRSAEAPPVRDAVLYAVDQQGLAHPTVVELPEHEDPSERLQDVVDALREVLIEEGTWPPELPPPTVHAFELERRAVAVLDLPRHDVRLDVARERSIVASLRRTIHEAGVDRLAFLRDGRTTRAWLGGIVTPSGLE